MYVARVPGLAARGCRAEPLRLRDDADRSGRAVDEPADHPAVDRAGGVGRDGREQSSRRHRVAGQAPPRLGHRVVPLREAVLMIAQLSLGTRE
jgi:hypothetical protein